MHQINTRRSDQGPGGVPDGGLLHQPPRGERRAAEAERPAGRGGPDRDSSGGLCPRCLLLADGDKYGGMAYGAAVNGKWDGTVTSR